MFPITVAHTNYSSHKMFQSQSEITNVESVASNSQIYSDDNESSHTEIVIREDTTESTDAV